MKNIKLIFSTLALVFAVGGAIATNAFSSSALVPVDVSANQNQCPTHGECSSASGTCAVSGIPLFRILTNPTTCANQAGGTFTAD